MRLTEYDVSKHWAMFTSEGNRRIRGYAQTLVRQINQGRDADDAARSFITKWVRLSYNKKFGEASDTAVREAVLGFAEYVLNLSTGRPPIYHDTPIDEIYDEVMTKAIREQRS